MLADIPALILAGGLGTRLRPVLADRPKALAPIMGRPFLHYLLKKLEHEGFRRVVLSTGYLAEAIAAEFGQRYGRLMLSYCQEETPLGTGGALRFASAGLNAEQVCVINGDSFCDLNYRGFAAEHLKRGTGATVAITKLNDTSRFGRVDFDDNHKILAYQEKGLSGPGWINVGIYLIPLPKILQIPGGVPVSIERDVFPGWCHEGSMFAYFEESGRFIDIGTPESLREAAVFFSES